QLAVDLVILNERATSYVQDLQAALDGLVRAGRPRAPSVGADARGSVFVIRADQVSAESRGVLGSIARAVSIGGRGSLSEQVRRGPESVAEAKLPVRVPRGAPVRPVARRADMAREDTEFFNGLGGFADRGREYVTVLGEGQSTPAPWLNVVANE